jgi:flagellin
MSSILTNNSAMVALQTLRGINKNLAQTQSEISTGKSVSSARDNAAVWSISKTMESDVRGFKAISDSLSLGSSTVSVARQASETVTDLLTKMKGLIVSAQEENVDRGKIQTDIDALKSQIGSVVGAAQFNGLNFVDNSRTETVLASLDRSAGGVTANRISVGGQDLTQREQIEGTDTARVGQATVTGGAALVAASNTVAGANLAIGGPASTSGTMSLAFATGGKTFNISISIENADTATTIRDRMVAAIDQNDEMRTLGINAGVDGTNVTIRLGGQARADGVSITGASTATGATIPATTNIAASAQTVQLGAGTIQAGDTFRVSYGADQFAFVANETTSRDDALAGLAKQINDSSAYFARVSDTGTIQVTARGTGALAASTGTINSGGTAGGGLTDLRNLNVSDFSSLRGGADGNTAFNDLNDTDQRAVIRESLNKSLADVETMIQSAINSTASFGSVQSRIDTQKEFVGKLSDALTTGIGSLVDADMEATSARLQALQVQQQLATQSLSIANQQPQNILALFR